MIHQETIRQHTRGRGTYDITRKVHEVVSHAGASAGLCHVFVSHTSASLILSPRLLPADNSSRSRKMGLRRDGTAPRAVSRPTSRDGTL